MVSQLSSRDDVNKILSWLGERVDQPIQVIVIGGAAMLEYDLKDATKDIDLVCRDNVGKASLLRAAKGWASRLLGLRRGMLV